MTKSPGHLDVTLLGLQHQYSGDRTVSVNVETREKRMNEKQEIVPQEHLGQTFSQYYSLYLVPTLVCKQASCCVVISFMFG